MPQYNEVVEGPNRLVPSDHDPSLHSQNNNNGGTADLNRLLNSTACNVSLGVVLLLVGIVVTSITFKEYRATNKMFLLGPILVGAGVLGIGKAVLKKYHFRDNEQRRRRRRHRRQPTRNSQRTDSDSMYGENTDSFNRLQGDAPPPYDIVTTSRCALLPSSQTAVVEVPSLPNYSEIDPLPPPPKYEEVIGENCNEIHVNGSLEEDNTGLLTEFIHDDEEESTQNESSSRNLNSTSTELICNSESQVQEHLTENVNIQDNTDVRAEDNGLSVNNNIDDELEIQTVQRNNLTMQNNGATNTGNSQLN